MFFFCRFAVLLSGGKHTGFFPGRHKKKKEKEKRVPPGFFPRANLGTISPKLIKHKLIACAGPHLDMECVVLLALLKFAVMSECLILLPSVC